MPGAFCIAAQSRLGLTRLWPHALPCHVSARVVPLFTARGAEVGPGPLLSTTAGVLLPAASTELGGGSSFITTIEAIL